MKKALLASVSAFLLTTTLTTPVLGQTSALRAEFHCRPRSEALDYFGNRYGERVVFRDVTSNGNLIELFVNQSTGTWSFTFTLPDGPTCLIAAGQNYEELNEGVGSTY